MMKKDTSATQKTPRLALYTALKAHYEKMLEVACANDWEHLTRLQEQAQAQLAEIEQTLPEPNEDTAAVAEIITAILALDGKIAEHTLPCLESTRKLLHGVTQDKNVRKAYGAF